ncbi:MAG: phosphoenolpyruvate carboxykinase (ATP) [Chitinophagaceae bacterium]|nr:phosphoenolpyruvate carboxykinase (ATP) [Chitinophagaceae bacterium]
MTVSTIATENKQVRLGLLLSENTHYQLSPKILVEDTLRLDEGYLDESGALVISTGEFTGRSPKDKYIVKDDITAGTVDWNTFNIPIEIKYFERVFDSCMNYLDRLPELWVRDCYACADPRYRMNVRVINEKPWGNLFAYNMFLRPEPAELKTFRPDWHVISVPGLELDKDDCGTRSKHAAVISFRHKMILIAGTGYTGEIKKGIFTVLNYILPHHHDVLSMHCSANIGNNGDTALFFGLSGTGKTTLSADPTRMLIGDDEHGWTHDGIFNFEGGCYAKVINLDEEKEPEIFHAIHDGALLENTVCFAGSKKTNFASSCITENTRVSYPVHYIANAKKPSTGNIPSNIFFLTCDASGVLPPISKLTAAQAMYQFISGYTAKIAGTETGITEPVSTFSACFGAPFIPLHPGKYAAMLGEKIRKHKVNVWLVNTGWTGGAYGSGSRIKLQYTRAMIAAALTGKLENVRCDRHPVFGMDIPAECPGVPSPMLYPRNTWNDKDAYDAQALILAKKFIKNFEKYEDGVDAEIRSARPLI